MPAPSATVDRNPMPYPADNAPMDSQHPARVALRTAHQKRLAADEAEAAAVAAARAAGVTWDQIGTDIDMAGPNAHRKYAKRVTPAKPNQETTP